MKPFIWNCGTKMWNELPPWTQSVRITATWSLTSGKAFYLLIPPYPSNGKWEDSECWGRKDLPNCTTGQQEQSSVSWVWCHLQSTVLWHSRGMPWRLWEVGPSDQTDGQSRKQPLVDRLWTSQANKRWHLSPISRAYQNVCFQEA